MMIVDVAEAEACVYYCPSIFDMYQILPVVEDVQYEMLPKYTQIKTIRILELLMRV
jgi:hypothetical protein